MLVSRTGLVRAFRLNDPIVNPSEFLMVYYSHHGLGRTATRVVEYSASRRFDPCADTHSQA